MKTFNPLQTLRHEITARGGFVNCHAHLDRAYTITPKNFHLTGAQLKQKWTLVNKGKEESTVTDIYDRMARALEDMLIQGVQAVGTCIDIDNITKDKAIRAAQKLRCVYQHDINLKFINQTLAGVVTPEARQWFSLAVQFVDIIGGLPKVDAGYEEQHLDILLGTAKAQGKPVHVHVDQNNDPQEKETELLVQKTIEHGMQGNVTAIHCISLGAHPIQYRKKIYQKMREASVMVICCPSAWIDSRRNEVKTPTHNSTTPIDEMAPAGIVVGLGIDNIFDIYKPFANGDLLVELRFLLEACHFYCIETLADIATTNGLKILRLPH